MNKKARSLSFSLVLALLLLGGALILLGTIGGQPIATHARVPAAPLADAPPSTGGPTDLTPIFGPTHPVTPEPNTTYYFRARAVDRVGNAEAEHPIFDTVTTYQSDGYRLYLPLVLRNYAP